MNASSPLPSWRDDLRAARDVSESQRAGFELVLAWFESWRVRQHLPPGREAARAFWVQQVKAKRRTSWQLDQWKEAIGWYLQWLSHAERSGREARTLEERVFLAVDRAGGRRGLALRTRQTYGRWAMRFARWAGSAKATLEQARGRAFLTALVVEEKPSFSSQKQALNALMFFFKEVCGQAEVDLEVRLRPTSKRIPVVINFREVLAILEKLPPPYRLMAEVQDGGGLRRGELAPLRVKEVDLDRRQITLRQGKGDLDRVTVLPGLTGARGGVIRPLEAASDGSHSLMVRHGQSSAATELVLLGGGTYQGTPGSALRRPELNLRQDALRRRGFRDPSPGLVQLPRWGLPGSEGFSAE